MSNRSGPAGELGDTAEPASAHPSLVSRTVSFFSGPRHWRLIVLVLAVIGLAVAVFPLISDQYYLNVVATALVASIIAIPTNLLTGQAGLFSIGNAAFMAIGAWVVVVLANSVGFVASVLLAASVCGVVGVIIGIPSLRLRNFYMVLTTLALQFIVAAAFLQYEIATKNPGGFYLPVASIGPVQLAGVHAWYVALVVVLVAIYAATWALFSSRVGRAWLAIREHDVAAAAIGVNITYYKLLAFAVSSFMIGLGGALDAYFVRFVSADTYTLDLAIGYVAMIIIGGLGSLPGSVIGAFVFTLLPVIVENIGGSLPQTGGAGSFIVQNEFYIESAIYGALVLVFLYRYPRGIAGLAKQLTVRRLVGRRAGMLSFDVRALAAKEPAPAKPETGGATR